jgi:hypothetical protein
MDYTPLAKWDAQDTQNFAHVSMVDIASGRSTRSGNSARRWVVPTAQEAGWEVDPTTWYIYTEYIYTIHIDICIYL